MLLSDALWRSQFGGDPSAVGRDLRLDGQPYTDRRRDAAVVRGPGARRPASGGRSRSRPSRSPTSSRHSNNYWNVGRLKPGATLEQAQAQVDALNAANLERFPQYKELLINAGFRTVGRPPARTTWCGTSSRPSTCSGAARCFVLLIGCVNVANLVAGARAGARQGDGHPAGARRAALAARAAARGRERAADRGSPPALGLLVGAAALRAASAPSTSRTCPTAARSASTAPRRSTRSPLALAIGVVMGLVPARERAAREPERRAARGRPRLDRRRRRARAAPHAGRGAGGLHLRAAARRGPAARELPQRAARSTPASWPSA